MQPKPKIWVFCCNPAPSVLRISTTSTQKIISYCRLIAFQKIYEAIICNYCNHLIHINSIAKKKYCEKNIIFLYIVSLF